MKLILFVMVTIVGVLGFTALNFLFGIFIEEQMKKSSTFKDCYGEHSVSFGTCPDCGITDVFKNIHCSNSKSQRFFNRMFALASIITTILYFVYIVTIYKYLIH